MVIISGLIDSFTCMLDAETFEGADINIGQHNGSMRDVYKRQAVVSALADKKTFREEMYQRAERFERNYKKRIRRGFAAILIIPLIFLILMFKMCIRDSSPTKVS